MVNKTLDFILTSVSKYHTSAYINHCTEYPCQNNMKSHASHTPVYICFQFLLSFLLCENKQKRTQEQANSTYSENA